MNENNNRVAYLREKSDVMSAQPERRSPLDRVRIRMYVPRKKLLTIITSVVLILGILIDVMILVFVNPLARATVRVAMTQNYTIKMIARYNSLREELTIKVVGNFIQHIDDDGNSTYYVLDGEKAYKYVWENGRWVISECFGENFSGSIVGGSDEDNLFNLENYRKNPKKLFEWELKPGVDCGDYKYVRAYNLPGMVQIKAHTIIRGATVDVQFLFCSFGSTKI